MFGFFRKKRPPKYDPILPDNCRVGFRCSKTWDSLRDTGTGDVRYCDSCRRNVHFCETEGQLVDAVKRKDCVAFKTADPAAPDELLDVFMGLIKQRSDK